MPHSISRRHNRRALLAATALLLVLAAPARARVVDPGSGPFEVGQTQTGNYLSAIVASDDRDTAGSAFYFREALRADPRNVDLIERAFAAALANGDGINAFALADRLIARDPGNSLARLALATRAISEGSMPRRARNSRPETRAGRTTSPRRCSRPGPGPARAICGARWRP